MKRAKTMHDAGPAGILQGGKPGVQTVRVREDIVNTCWQFYVRNPVMRACRNVIYGILFSGTVEIVSEEKGVVTTPEFAEYLRKHWLPFAKDVADNLRVLGYVPYCFRPDTEDGQNQIPVVPPRNTYTTEMRVHADFSQSLHLRTRLGSHETILDYVEYFVQSYPNMSGELDSSMIALAPAIIRLEALTNAAVECDINAARPTMVTQSRKEVDTLKGSAATLAVSTGVAQWASESVVSQTQARHQDEDLRMLQRLQVAREQAIEYNQKAMAEASDPASSELGMQKSRNTPGAETKSNILNLPKGLEYVQTRPSAPHQDLQTMNNLVEDLICAEMGVPNSLIHPSHSSFDSGTLVQRVVNMELVRLAKILERVMTQAYKQLYGASDEHVVLRYPTFCDPELLLNACAQVDLYDQKYVGELFARASGFWCDGITEQYIVSSDELERKKRDTKAYETELDLYADHARAEWAAAQAQTQSSVDGQSRRSNVFLRKPARPPSSDEYRRGADGGSQLSTDASPPSLVPTRRANQARRRPVSSAGQSVANAKARLKKRENRQ